MATLTALKFDTAEGAQQMETLMLRLQQQGLIQVHDGAVVYWPKGARKPKTEQLNSLAGAGALGGAFWGMLFGLLFFVPLLGMAVGAGIGALTGAFRDVGIDDTFINQVKRSITPGTSALFLLTSNAVPDRVIEAIKQQGLKPELISSNLSADQEAKLRETFAEPDEGHVSNANGSDERGSEADAGAELQDAADEPELAAAETALEGAGNLAAAGSLAAAAASFEADAGAELQNAADEPELAAAETALEGAGNLAAAAASFEAAAGYEDAEKRQLAAGASDLTRAQDLAVVADRVGRLSEIAAQAGVTDVAEGVELLAASEDIATLSDLIGAMSEADLEHGLELARLSGELRAAGAIVTRLEMPILATFLHGRSVQLDDLAVNAVLRSSSTRVLSAAMSATGANVADLSAREVAEGVVRLAASQALAERSGALAGAAVDRALAGAAELDAAADLGTAARTERARGAGALAADSAERGADAVEVAIADSLEDDAQS